ncbi:hypothetical protein FOPE_12300 [Fonsecaea pedrosoi]|nr:hypothetical protein FOPE_12300 [Fonsecaea pedrosoi]
MPHKSVRRTLGIEPPDLYREHWHPDRKNIEREKCKVFRKEQKLLICELQDDLPSSSSYTTTTLSSASPRKWSSFSPIRRLFKRSKRHRRSQATSQGDRSRSNMTPRYKIVGKIYPSDKSTGVFKSVPAGLLALEPVSSCHPELIHDVRHYLRQRPHRQDWTIKGALPKSGQTPSTAVGTEKGLSWRSPELANRGCSTSPASRPPGSRGQRRFVLLERRVRCNCEESFHPRHRLRVFYKLGYVPDPQKAAEAKRKAERIERQRARTTIALSTTTIACGAGAVIAAGT